MKIEQYKEENTSGAVLNRQEKRAVFQIYRKVESQHYLKLGLTHELLECGYYRRKVAQTKVLKTAKIDTSKSKFTDKIGSMELSVDIAEAVKQFAEHMIAKNDYGPEVVSRRILVQLGIQELVKPIISSNLKALGAYLCKDTEKGRRGFSPDIIQTVYDCIQGRDDFPVIGLEDLRYLIQIGYNKESLNDNERKDAIRNGIRIITTDGYLPIEESPFVAAFVSSRGTLVSHDQLLNYMQSDTDERARIDEQFSNM